MKLIYRGVTYDYEASKGVARQPFQHIHAFKSPYELIYRGNTYRVDPTTIEMLTLSPMN